MTRVSLILERMPISENEAVISQSEEHDVLILSGGVSVGTYDLVTEALEKCGAQILGWIIPHTFLPGRMSTNWFI